MAKRKYTRKNIRRKKTRGRKRKSRRVKKRKRRKTKKRRRGQKGGSGCPYSKNMGQYFTLRKYNNNPMLPDPKSTNLSSDIPYPYSGQTALISAEAAGGGKKSRRRRRNQKGGSWYDFGFTDLISSYFDGGKSLTDIPLKWRGKKTQLGSNPMKQKIKSARMQHSIPDIESHHRHGIIQAANYGDVSRTVPQSTD